MSKLLDNKKSTMYFLVIASSDVATSNFAGA